MPFLPTALDLVNEEQKERKFRSVGDFVSVSEKRENRNRQKCKDRYGATERRERE
jgi:hypothetical protein